MCISQEEGNRLLRELKDERVEGRNAEELLPKERMVEEIRQREKESEERFPFVLSTIP